MDDCASILDSIAHYFFIPTSPFIQLNDFYTCNNIHVRKSKKVSNTVTIQFRFRLHLLNRLPVCPFTAHVLLITRDMVHVYLA